MKVGQPITFVVDGTDVVGIVKTVLPDKGGVIAYVKNTTGEIKEFKVVEPHKIRNEHDVKLVVSAFKHLPEAQEFMEQSAFYKPEKPVAPKKKTTSTATPIPTEVEYHQVFLDALKAISFPDEADQARLRAMTVKV